MQLAPSLPLVQLVSYKEKAYVPESELKDLKEYAVGIGVNYTSLTEGLCSEG
ncbi:hypothetical protein [Oceanobacillus polygoni]|uniref:Glycerophosphoryl diester phosphodiesterase n=1 Tax=Oceanobacillus polygoni TaxID=1235259 RepID=A0A9X1CAS0_9BACI|nr:hypothetical protein [Oceanobacillus polygoni]MBP2076151.1 glycerophosphoryl diester phosphodiesterase [Oceanobacillus polygoni]